MKLCTYDKSGEGVNVPLNNGVRFITLFTQIQIKDSSMVSYWVLNRGRKQLIFISIYTVEVSRNG